MRSSVAAVFSASFAPRGLPLTPAAQRTVRASMRSTPRGPCSARPESSTAVTRAPVRTRTPSSSRESFALSDSSGGKDGRIRCAASTSRISESSGRNDRKLSLSVSFAISASIPVSSTPVGPLPTTMKVSHAFRLSGSVSRSATSKAKKIFWRIHPLSSMLLSPGATCSQAPWP